MPTRRDSGRAVLNPSQIEVELNRHLPARIQKSYIGPPFIYRTVLDHYIGPYRTAVCFIVNRHLLGHHSILNHKCKTRRTVRF